MIRMSSQNEMALWNSYKFVMHSLELLHVIPVSYNQFCLRFRRPSPSVFWDYRLMASSRPIYRTSERSNKPDVRQARLRSLVRWRGYRLCLAKFPCDLKVVSGFAVGASCNFLPRFAFFFWDLQQCRASKHKHTWWKCDFSRFRQISHCLQKISQIWIRCFDKVPILHLLHRSWWQSIHYGTEGSMEEGEFSATNALHRQFCELS